MKIRVKNETIVSGDGTQTLTSRYELEPCDKVTLQYHHLAPPGDLLVPGLSTTFRPALGAPRHKDAYCAHQAEQQRLFSDVVRKVVIVGISLTAACMLGVAIAGVAAGPWGVAVVMLNLAPVLLYTCLHVRALCLAAYRARVTADVAVRLCSAYEWLAEERTMADKAFAVGQMDRALRRSYVRGLRDARLDPLMSAYCNLLNEVFA